MERRLFGTNGVRGVFNRDLTPEIVLNLAYSIASFHGQKTNLLVGGDGRLSTPLLLRIVEAGLTACGCNVHSINSVPTPCIQYATKAWDLDGAVAVTASHNPPEYNGIKVVGRDGVELPHEAEQEIEKICFGRSWKLASWDSVGARIERSDALDVYTRGILSQLDRTSIARKNLKIVIDPGNGVGSLVSPYIARILGCKVQTINSNVDGSFPGRQPEPTPANLGLLSRAVIAFNADLGVAHDGDADRAIFVDEKGQIYWGDKSFALILDRFLAENPGETVVTPVSSSQLIPNIVSKYHGRLIWTKVGSINVSRIMLKENAKIGGEENGGVFYGPHQPVRDGAMTFGLILQILAQSGRSLSSLLAEQPSYAVVKEKVACPPERTQQVLQALRTKTKEKRVETIDGLKIWPDENSWILIRPSGTEPIYRLFAEAPHEDQARRLVETYKNMIMGVIRELG